MTSAVNCGNQVGVITVCVWCDGPLHDRLRHGAATTRRRRPPGTAVTVVADADRGQASRLQALAYAFAAASRHDMPVDIIIA
jgi:hypothetical protein